MTDTLPVNPMLAELTAAPADGRFGHPFTSDRYAYELKWDGHRIIASISNRGVQLWARSGRLVTPDYQEIADAVAALELPAGTILDGEAIALKDGRVNLQALQARGLRPAQWRRENLRYKVFDLIAYGGIDLTGSTFAQRRENLARASKSLTERGEAVVSISSYSKEGRAAWALVEEHQLEGLIAKPLASRYLFGERGTWLKIKLIQRGPFVVVGWTGAAAGNGIGRELGALIVAEPGTDGLLRVAGKVGTGYTVPESDRLIGLMGPDAEPALSKKEQARAGRDVRWVEPRLIVEVEYAERTDDQVIRFASYKRVLSQPAPVQAVVAQARVEVKRAARAEANHVVTFPSGVAVGVRVPTAGDVYEAPGSSGTRLVLVKASAAGPLYLACPCPAGRFVWKGGSFKPCKHMTFVLAGELAGTKLVDGHFA